MKVDFKEPICEKCGRRMKGRIPADAEHVTCFFCHNPPFDDADEENTALQSKDKR